MTVRNVRTRNWNNSSTGNVTHHHHFRGGDTHRPTRWMIRLLVVVVVILSSSILFLFVRRIWTNSNLNSTKNTLDTSSIRIPQSEHRWSSSPLSLHRLYASSMNRYRRHVNDHHHSDDILPIHSILYRTYQQQQQKKASSSKLPSTQHRIAMLLPYTTTPSPPQQNNNNDNHNNYASILSYFTLFCYSVAGTADIMDFYIFHTGIITHNRTSSDSSGQEQDEEEVDWDVLRNHTMLQHCPPNVIFVNLQNHYGLAQYLLRVVDVKYNPNTNRTTTATEAEPSLPSTPKLPVMKYQELLDLVESYIKMNPYGLVEFKPALGHIFSDFINSNDPTATQYTHWGYTDFDIVFGDISRWLTLEELNNYDIVTYTFGDQQRLYVRGQFTIHKNQPNSINQLWRHCSYLSNLDERFESIVQHTTKYHVESAEGCYSAVLLNQTNISIKFAVKAWTDIYADDTAYTHGVAISQSPISGRQILYKLQQGGERNEKSRERFYKLRSSWFENDDLMYNKDRSVDLQRPTGERIRLDDPYDNDSASSPSSNKEKKKKPCMYWALEKYQSKLCLKDGIVSSNDTVYYINGVLYKQSYENIHIFPNELDDQIISAPLFHFQEWKRSYRNEQLTPIYASLLSSSTASSLLNTDNDINTFLLTPNGVIPMISSSFQNSLTNEKTDKKNASTKSVVSSPLSVLDMNTWSSAMHLPLSTYCIRSRLDGSKRRTKCDTAISYHDDKGHLTILSHAPEWTNVNTEADVTLVLTLQFLASWDIDRNEVLVQNVIDNAKLNIDRWYGQPCVLVISLPNSLYEKTTNYLRRQFDIETNSNFGSCFIVNFSHDQVQEHNDADTISRKALLNMAIDVVPTRWYVSGIELERGLVISMDTSYMAHRTAVTYSSLRGNIFMIPQFGIIDTMAEKDSDNENVHADGFKSSFDELLRLKRSGKVRPLGEEWDSDCSDHEESLDELTKRIDDIWMAESLLLIGSLTSDIDPNDVNAKLIRGIDSLQQYLLQMALDGMDENYEDTEMYTYNESPILLTDNLGPYDGIRTSEVVREVEAFASIRCYNSVRLSQMIMMNYTLNMLPMAFVSKSSHATIMYSEMKKQQQHILTKRCPAMCTNFLDDDEEILFEIARSETKRAAMTAIVWAETVGIKPLLPLDVE